MRRDPNIFIDREDKNSHTKNNNFYNSMMAHSPFAIALIDVSNDTFHDVNFTFEDLFKYSRKELVNKKISVIKCQNNKIWLDKNEIYSYQNPIPKNQKRVKLYKSNLESFWAKITSSLVVVDNQEYIMTTIMDVTDQESSEVKLKKSQEQYKSLFDHSLNTIGIYDIEQHCFIDCNPTFTDVYGYEKEDLINLTAVDLAWQDIDGTDLIYQKRYLENIQQLKQKKTLRFQSEHKGKSGAKILVEVVLVPIYINDQFYIKQVTTDITERILTRQKLDNQMQKLEEANNSLKKHIESNLQLENFAHVTSHDLKEPIRTIIGFSQLLKKNISQDNDRNLEYVDFIINSGNRINNMINDILSFSKVNNNNLVFNEIDPKILLNNICIDLNANIKKQEAEIISKNLPPIIKGQDSYIYQLFQNLIKNGIKFRKTEENPIICVDYKDENTHHQFCISDNGIGIDKEYFDKIFGMFKKLHSSSKFEGSGIGLSVCSKVVEYHKGKIWVESQLGVGTQFYFTLAKDLS